MSTPIDWTQYLNSSIGAAQADPQGSLFPSTPWSNLASAIRGATVALAAPKAQAQTNMIGMINAAKPFGTLGLRKLYQDPKFQALAKQTNTVLPDLPPLTAEEQLELRKEQFFTESQAAATAQHQARVASGEVAAPATPSTVATPAATAGYVQDPATGKWVLQQNVYAGGGGSFAQVPKGAAGEIPTGTTAAPSPFVSVTQPSAAAATTAGPSAAPTDAQGAAPPADTLTQPQGVTPSQPEETPQDWRRIYAQLALKYPEAADALGIVPRIAASTENAILHGMFDYRVAPQTVMAAITQALASVGGDINLLDPATRQSFETGISAYAQAQLQDIAAQVQQRISASALSTARKDDLQNTSAARIADLNAKVYEALQAGDHQKALTLLTEAQTQWLPDLDKSLIQYRKETGGAAVTRAAAYKEVSDANVPLKRADTALAITNQQVLSSQGKESLAGQQAWLHALVSDYAALMRRKSALEAAIPTANFTQDDIDAAIKQNDADIALNQQNQYLANQNIGYIAASTPGQKPTLNQPLPPNDPGSANPTNPGDSNANPTGAQPGLGSNVGLSMGSQAAVTAMMGKSDVWKGTNKDITTHFSRLWSSFLTSKGGQKISSAPDGPDQIQAIWNKVRQLALQKYKIDIGDMPVTVDPSSIKPFGQ